MRTYQIDEIFEILDDRISVGMSIGHWWPFINFFCESFEFLSRSGRIWQDNCSAFIKLSKTVIFHVLIKYGTHLTICTSFVWFCTFYWTKYSSQKSDNFIYYATFRLFICSILHKSYVTTMVRYWKQMLAQRI